MLIKNMHHELRGTEEPLILSDGTIQLDTEFVQIINREGKPMFSIMVKDYGEEGSVAIEIQTSSTIFTEDAVFGEPIAVRPVASNSVRIERVKWVQQPSLKAGQD